MEPFGSADYSMKIMGMPSVEVRPETGLANLNKTMDYRELDILQSMNVFRKDGGQFCDVTIEVEGVEVSAHKSVLMAFSPYLHELFTAKNDTNHHAGRYRLRDVNAEAFQILVDFAYTSSLHVPGGLVQAVYAAAKKLKVSKALEACRCHLHDTLSSETCISVGQFAREMEDRVLTECCDGYTQSHLNTVKQSKAYMGLPKAFVKVMGADEWRLGCASEHQVCKIVVGWVSLDAARLDAMCDHESVLLLTPENHLMDCTGMELPTGDLTDESLRKLTKKLLKKPNVNPAPQASAPFSPDNSRQMRIIATEQLSQNTFMCLADIHQQLLILSINFQLVAQRRLSESSSGASSDEGCTSSDGCSGGGTQGSSAVGSEGSCDHGYETLGPYRLSSFCPIAPMSTPRCGAGLAVFDHQVVTMGGNDRGRCLDTVEQYNFDDNSWTNLPAMKTRRGRLACTEFRKCLYAIGGSDGRSELNTAERLCPGAESWEAIAPLPGARSSAGAGSLNGRLYVIGGWTGQTAESSCVVYDPAEDEWIPICPLSEGRSQVAVCALQGRLYAVGGTDSWNCSRTVEAYDPSTDTWTYVAPMNTMRRGAGLVIHKGKLFVVGGSDGSCSLNTTEVYDPERNTWAPGPQLSQGRANAGVTRIGRHVFAAGGFNGKEFLDCSEYLSESGESEWCSYAKVSSGSEPEDTDTEHSPTAPLSTTTPAPHPTGAAPSSTGAAPSSTGAAPSSTGAAPSSTGGASQTTVR